MTDRIEVEVVYALPRDQRCVALQLPPDSTALDAIEASGLLDILDLQAQDLQAGHVGIFGRRTPLATPLVAGDRVELYRPLHLSPTEARRLRARTMAEKGDR